MYQKSPTLCVRFGGLLRFLLRCAALSQRICYRYPNKNGAKTSRVFSG